MTTNEAISKSEKSDKRVLTIPDSMADTLINLAQDAITENLIKQEELLPELEKKKAEYEEVVHKIEAISHGADEYKKLLEGLVKTKTGDGVQIKVYKSLSNTDVKRRERKRNGNIPWQRVINEVLTAHGGFMTFDEIYAAILEKHPSWTFKDKLAKTKYERYYLRDGVVSGKVKDFSYYNGRFGLVHWMAGQTPKPQYMKAFMFDQQTA